ncbi:FecR domain-containing protein [Piscinibacter sp. HJYY11]|uniref:FecR family protein n=1 Tax=Piscinibacter sp. HJYY11 TaxID=2801333 RepID=UPI002872B16C|nr:FecR domain-containing protein [Piscinibacter sp. HJYY11]
MSRPQTVLEEGDRGDAPLVVPRQVLAEAAVWVARLHGPDRSARMERDCLAWQARSAAHRRALEKCTDTWQDVPRLTLGDAYARAVSPSGAARVSGRAWRRARWVLGAGLAVVCAAVGIGIQQWRELGRHVTDVGEQQLIVLDDGSRVSLNTASRVRVSLGSQQRLVTVEAGEALFEVARDRRRPFVVRAAGAEVVAVGTTFAVRLQGGRADVANSLSVTLVEGQVIVWHAEGTASGQDALPSPLALQAGQRLQLIHRAGIGGWTQTLDRPHIESLLAWKRSLASFVDVSLADAVAEMNRYSRTPIVLVDRERLASLRVSGEFKTADLMGFARAMANLHDLHLQEAGGRLELYAYPSTSGWRRVGACGAQVLEPPAEPRLVSCGALISPGGLVTKG